MNIIITESQFRELVQKQLLEGVYVNGLKGNKALLSYGKGMTYHRGNLMPQDLVKTDKMEQNNNDTYIVPLKGGINSYNITSIKGQEVMHYFKYYWDSKKAEVKVKDKEGNEKNYELEMEKREFNDFLQQFIKKVSIVIEHYVSNNNVGEISKISIYPVPSSSRFNEEMSKELIGMNILGLPIQVINQKLFYKDTSNIQRDNDFIEKNKEYYNSEMSQVAGYKKPVLSFLDTAVNRNHAMQEFDRFINGLNECTKQMLQTLNNYKNGPSKGSQTTLKTLAWTYRYYCDIMDQSVKICTYNDAVRGVEDAQIHFNKIANQKKYSKNASIEKRTEIIWEFIKNTPYIRGQRSPITGKPYTKREINYWEYTPFQMKSLSNGERMGLKNFFSIDTNVLQQEIKRIQGTLFVIFDDNVSGGATLSDICLQAKKAGIQNILPITFGQMGVKWEKGVIPLTRPTDKNGNYGYFNT